MRTLLIIGLIIVLYVILRRMASHDKAAETYSLPVVPTPLTVEATQERESAQFEVRSYRFTHMQARIGPDNPEAFFDELVLDVTSLSTGEAHRTVLPVCTPEGLSEEMKRSNQRSMSPEELLVVLRYDLDAILDGANDRLNELYDSHVLIPRH